MCHDTYLHLRAFLDRLPGGFPATESGVELRILQKLFTPEDAGIFMLFDPSRAEHISALAPRLGLDEQEATAKIESMAERGLVFRHRRRGETRYLLTQFVIGIYERQIKTMDHELALLVEQYLPYLTHSWSDTKTKQNRVVPVETAYHATPAIADYDRIRELVKDQELISVAPCICRKEQGLLGHPCDRPSETCLGFGTAARYYIDNGLGRQIGHDELRAILDLAEHHSLVPSPANARDITFMCLCCGCCCAILRGAKRMPRPADEMQSSFYCRIDKERCSTCGLCVERCQMDAIRDGDGVKEVDLARCIGCGLCAAACRDGAISLVAKPDVPSVPANFVETGRRIALERGVFC